MSADAQGSREPAECVVELGGQALSDALRAALREVAVHEARGSATTGTLRFDSYRESDGSWSVVDAAEVSPWATVKIEAAFGESKQEILRGFVREIRVEFPADMSEASVVVEVQDRTLALDRVHHRRVWGGDDSISDREIVDELAGEVFSQVEAEEGDTHEVIHQDATAAAFLNARADAIGYELYAREDTLYFHAPRLDDSPQPRLSIHAGPNTNCRNFSLRHDGHRPDRIEVVLAERDGAGADSLSVESQLRALGGERTTGEASGLPTFSWQLSRPRGARRSAVEALARATVDRHAWKISAEGELDGALYGHVLRTRATVEVEGVGSTHTGRYYVDAVEHTFSAAGYRQSFRLLRNATK